MANAYTNTNTNMTTSTGLTPGMQTYYNRELLRTFEPNLVHLQFGENYRMPMNSGITMNMRKMIPVAAKTTALEEGNPGDGKMLAEVAVTTTIQQFGDYARCSDWLDMVHLDENITRRVQRFGADKRRQRLGQTLQIPQPHRRLVFKTVAPLIIGVVADEVRLEIVKEAIRAVVDGQTENRHVVGIHHPMGKAHGLPAGDGLRGARDNVTEP